MNTIDNTLSKILGKAKKSGSMGCMKPMKRFSMNNSMNKMMGMKLNHPRVGSRPTKRDSDGDGIPNKKDCQPRNIIRQDSNQLKKFFVITIPESTESTGGSNEGYIDMVLKGSSLDDVTKRNNLKYINSDIAGHKLYTTNKISKLKGDGAFVVTDNPSKALKDINVQLEKWDNE